MLLTRADAKPSLPGPVRSAARLVRDHPWVWQAAILLLTIALTSYYTLRADRDFWYDEAMLVLAIRADGWLAPWQPLGHFEQASPWGVYLIQKLALSTVGFQPDLLRLPGLLAYAVGGLATWAAARIWLGGVASLLCGVWALASLDVVQSAGDFKHYIVEFCVAGVLLWLTARAGRSGSSGAFIALAVGALVSIPFSNTVVLVVPGLVVLLLILQRNRGRSWVNPMWVAAVFLCAYAAWYVVSIRPSTAFQVAYPTYRETSTVDLYTTVVQSVPQPSPTYVIPMVTLAAIGLVASLIWRRDLMLLALPALVAALLGWIGVWTGLVPISADRHVLFMVPMLALAAASAVRVVTALARTAVPPAVAGAALASATVGLVLSLGLTVTVAPNAGVLRQQAGQALAAYRTQCSTFYVDWWTQPATELYAQADGMTDIVRGSVSTRSGLGNQAWAYRVTDAPAAYQRRLVSWTSSHEGTCVLTGGRDDENSLVFDRLRTAGVSCSLLGVVPGIQVTLCRKDPSA